MDHHIYVKSFNCYANQLTSLFGAPKKIKGDFYIGDNSNLLDLSNIWNSDIKGDIYFDLNPGMAILPLIKFDNLRCNGNYEIISIHGKNYGNTKLNIIDFQFDLIENGFGDFARWKPSMRPNEVTGYFTCSHNKLTNLDGSTKYVGGRFQCEFNKLTSLYGVPK